jgi:hypothetical protein
LNDSYLNRNALTCGKLVYLRTLKCASTFFWNSFVRIGWVEILFDEINWQQQQVFSHIMDPGLRRIKGISEYVWMNQTQDRLASDLDYRKFIQQTPVLDTHTVSHYENFGNYCKQIDWIPMIPGANRRRVAELTGQLLCDQNIPFDHWEWSMDHASNKLKRSIAQQVTELLNHQHLPKINEYRRQDQGHRQGRRRKASSCCRRYHRRRPHEGGG